MRQLAELYPNSQVHYLHAPAIVDSEVTGEALLGDRIVQAGLEAARETDLALVGIGQIERVVDPGRRRPRLQRGFGPPGPRRRRRQDVNTCFFDDGGRAVPDLLRRTIAITLDELRAIDTVVAVAAGQRRSGRSAVRSRRARSMFLVTERRPQASVLTAMPD